MRATLKEIWKRSNGYSLAACGSTVLLVVSLVVLVERRKAPSTDGLGVVAGVAIRAEWDGHLWVEYRVAQGDHLAAAFTHHPDCPCQKSRQ